MKKIIFTIFVVVLMLSIFSGCTENLKAKPIATNFSEHISSNGGMAVVYGDYLYFINGYAGKDVDNKFGEVVRGAIARVSLKEGKPSGKAQIIVPKNVYGTDTSYGGLYIANDYIYYASTNTDLNSKGEAKVDEMVILRSKVDGSVTELVTKFDDHSTVFMVHGNNLVYIRNNSIFSINLADKKFVATTVEEGIISNGYLIDDEFIYYTKYNGDSTIDYVLKAYPLAGGEIKELINSKLLDATEKTVYTLTLLSVVDKTKDNFTMFYTKTDNGINTPEVGVYSYTFDRANFAFDKSKEIRFTYNKNDTTNLAYTKFYTAGDYYLALDSNRFDVFNKDGSRLKNTSREGEIINATIDVGSALTMFEVEEDDSGVFLWYMANSIVYKTKIFIKNAGYAFVEENAVRVFSGAHDTTYVKLEKIGNIIYYFNTNVSNNAYYFDIPSEITPQTETTAGKVLGIIPQLDIINAF